MNSSTSRRVVPGRSFTSTESLTARTTSGAACAKAGVSSKEPPCGPLADGNSPGAAWIPTIRTALRAEEARPASSTVSSWSSSPTLKPNRSAVRKLRLTSSGSLGTGSRPCSTLGGKYPADQAVSVTAG